MSSLRASTLSLPGNEAICREAGGGGAASQVTVVSLWKWPSCLEDSQGSPHARLPPCALQAFGAAGLSNDYPLAQFFAWARALRFADGPDEVHRATVAKIELRDRA